MSITSLSTMTGYAHVSYGWLSYSQTTILGDMRPSSSRHCTVYYTKSTVTSVLGYATGFGDDCADQQTHGREMALTWTLDVTRKHRHQTKVTRILQYLGGDLYELG